MWNTVTLALPDDDVWISVQVVQTSSFSWCYTRRKSRRCLGYRSDCLDFVFQLELHSKKVFFSRLDVLCWWSTHCEGTGVRFLLFGRSTKFSVWKLDFWSLIWSAFSWVICRRVSHKIGCFLAVDIYWKAGKLQLILLRFRVRRRKAIEMEKRPDCLNKSQWLPHT